MVSFTTQEGGPQIMERPGVISEHLGLGANVNGKVNVTMNMSMDGSDTSGSFTSTGSKRGPPSPGGPGVEGMGGVVAKRVKLQQADAQLASTVFKKFVNSALDEKALGNNRAYQELRRKFIAHPSDSDAPSSLELRQTISALTHTVSRLDKGCSQLVVDIVETTWAGRDNIFFKAYLRLLGNLVSAHSNYIPLVTKMLVHHLALGSSRMCTLPDHRPVTRQVIYDRTHEALEYIMELVPTAAHSTLFPALVAEFPNKSEKRLAHTTYLTNMLRVVEYAPALRSKIIAMVIERVIKIDIEVQADIEDLEDDEGDHLAWELNNSDAIDDENEDSSDTDDDDEEPEYISSVQRIKETVDKLDSLLEILFDFFSKFFPEEPQGENIINPETHVIFEHLLESFDKTILPTYQSRYTQFVMFWAVQKCPRFIDVFLGELIGCATDNNKSQVLRQAAAAYVASFVARAKMMDKTSVRTVVSVLCNWMNAFLIKREGDCSGPDIGKFGSFYSVFQAVMYIFCFRWRDLKIGEEDGDREDTVRLEQGERWIPGLLVMQRAIVSKFNPLKVCSHIVVNEFARISNFLNFLYCFSIIESNQRSLLGGPVGSANHHAAAANNGGAGGARSQIDRNALEAYFPFDPYKLKRSMKWVEGYYVEWEPVPGLDPEDSEDEEEDDDDDDDEEDEDSDEEGDDQEEGDGGEVTEADEGEDEDESDDE